MKILLVQSLSKNLKPVFPVGLARIASVIRGDHDVAVFDPNIAGHRARTALAEKLSSFDPDVVGVSLRNIDSVDYIGREFFYPDFVKLIRFVRERKPRAKIIVGGSGFSLFAREVMADNPDIDVGVFLEGENSFPELLRSLDNPSAVKGLYLREGGQIVFTGQRESVDFLNLPRPAYDLFELRRYLSRTIGIGIDSKRGCCLGCAYCPYSFLAGNNVRIRTPRDIVDEIEFLVATAGIRHFAFVDPVFNIPVDRGEAICREILSRKLDITWSCWTNEKFFTESFARLAMEAGCVAFPFSTDAFSDESLRLLNKNYTSRDILNVVETASKIGDINVGFSFFLNPPGATLRSLLDMMIFLIQTKRRLGPRMKRIFMINRIRIEPHTRMREIAIREGLISEQTNLLRPVYYTQSSTRIAELCYAALVFPLNAAIRLRRLVKNRFRSRF